MWPFFLGINVLNSRIMDSLCINLINIVIAVQIWLKVSFIAGMRCAQSVSN